jgi:hypothetical protein
MKSQQLLTQSKILEDDILSGPECTNNPAEDVPKPHDHGKNLTRQSPKQLIANSLISRVYDVLTNDRTRMDIQSIVTQLRQEASRIEHVIAALAGLGSQPAGRGRAPRRSHAKPAQVKKDHRMSPAGRKRISAAMRRRWAKWKGESAPKKAKAASKKHAGRKPMSAAMRKKLSAMMKARWAERKA